MAETSLRSGSIIYFRELIGTINGNSSFGEGFFPYGGGIFVDARRGPG